LALCPSRDSKQIQILDRQGVNGNALFAERYNMEKAKNRRRAYRLLLAPKFQLKYGAYFMTLALSSLLCSILVSVYFCLKVIMFAQQNPPAQDVLMSFVEFLKQHYLLASGSLAFMSLFYLGLAMLFTKRIVGPIRALTIHIDALKQGKYDFKTTLRKDDELRPLMVALNELSDSLKDRNTRAEFPLDKTGTH
jgi:hypothetical protein